MGGARSIRRRIRPTSPRPGRATWGRERKPHLCAGRPRSTTSGGENCGLHRRAATELHDDPDAPADTEENRRVRLSERGDGPASGTSHYHQHREYERDLSGPAIRTYAAERKSHQARSTSPTEQRESAPNRRTAENHQFTAHSGRPRYPRRTCEARDRRGKEPSSGVGSPQAGHTFRHDASGPPSMATVECSPPMGRTESAVILRG